MIGQVIKYKKKTKNGFEIRWGIMDPKDPSKILRSYKTKAEAEKSAKVNTGAAKMTDNRNKFTGNYSKMCKKPSLKESIDLLQRNGYTINECGDCESGDCFIELEDELGAQGCDANEIAMLMTHYADAINDLFDNGMGPTEVAEQLLMWQEEEYASGI